jgi:hypothetical protein
MSENKGARDVNIGAEFFKDPSFSKIGLWFYFPFNLSKTRHKLKR